MTAPSEYTFKRNPLTAKLFRHLWERRYGGAHKRFVFVATTGRSGTAFLQRVFSTAPGCASVHEAWPIMHGSVLRAWNEGEEWVARRTYWAQKSVNIRRLTGDSDLYVETNHLFIKSFAPYAVEDFGRRLSIIHLRRDAVSVARSMVELGAVPGTNHGNDWYLDYRAPRNLIQIEELLGPGGALDDDFFRCLWYWYEIEARIQEFRGRTEEIQWELLDWEDRMDPEELVGLIRAFGKEPDAEAIERLAGVKANRQRELKDFSAPPKEVLDEMHQRFRQVLRVRGLLPRVGM